MSPYPYIGPRPEDLPPEPNMALPGGPGTWCGLAVATALQRCLALVVDLIFLTACEMALKRVHLDNGNTEVLILFLNHGLLQGLTGQSIGKKVLGLHLIVPSEFSRRMPIAQEMGVVRGIVRCLLHFLDLFLAPLSLLHLFISDKRQTFADKLVGTVCLPTHERKQVAMMQTVTRQL